MRSDETDDYSSSTINQSELSEILVGEDHLEADLIPRSKTIPLARSHTKFGRKRKNDEFEAEIIDLMKKEDDEYDLFGKMLATKMRKLSEESRRLFLNFQMKMNVLINEMELESLEL